MPPAAGPFEHQPDDEAGKAVLADMEEARKRQDLPALKNALLKAKELPGCNKEWVDNAFHEIDMMLGAQQSAFSAGRGVEAIDMASRQFSLSSK